MRSPIAIVVVFLVATGCFRPGGGGCDHIPPSLVFIGEPTTLKLTFSVWGAGSGDLSKRYTRIRCHYRQSGQDGFLVLPIRLLSSDTKQMKVEAVIPAQTASGESLSLEYYFDCIFDGHTNSLPMQKVPIVKRPNQSAAANRRPAGQSDGSGNLTAIVAADRALPAAVAELDRRRLMLYYIANSKMPEVSGFNSAARRFLLKCARRNLFAQRPWLRWTIVAFTFVGIAIGVWSVSLVPSFLVSSDTALLAGIVPSLVIWAGAVIGFYCGWFLQSLYIRPHLRRLID